MSAGGAAYDLTQPHREPRADAIGHQNQTCVPLAGLLRKWLSACAAILGTCAASWLAHFFLTPSLAVEQAMPDVVAVLVFFLVARPR